MRNILFALVLWAMSSMGVLAVPANPKPFTVRQSDGTLITLQLVGDESLHYMQTTDGVPVVRRADGTYCYAYMDGGVLLPSELVAHSSEMRTADEQAFLSKQASLKTELTALRIQRMASRNARRAKSHPLSLTTSSVGEGAGATGKRKGLVILVNFKDKSMLDTSSREAFDDMMNKEGYSENENAGSVHDYFLAQSYGQFDLTFDVVGPVTVQYNMSYYGGNDSYGNDKNPATMVYEACKLVDSQVDFSTYDWDNDGEVDQVYVIYAGYSEAAGASANCIWPHEWQLTYAGLNLTLDGVKVNTYGCSSELYGTSGSRMDGIGTACHEFSHCLGLPDLYDTDSQTNFGMDMWSIMDVGVYCGDGFAPCGYTAYERWVSGWLTPKELSSPCAIEGMKSLDKSPEAYVIYNDANRSECYILENRQQDGWFAYDEAHGMLVTHLDYDKTAWEYNEVNNTASHQRCTIIPADNMATSETLSGDLFPGTNNKTELTDESTPAARLYNANVNGEKYLGKPITDITESADGLISFAFMGGKQLDAPVVTTPATNLTATGFTAGWQPVSEAETYTVELRHVGGGTAAESVLLTENFSTWGADLTKDSSVDMSKKLDEYTSTKGWSGEYLFCGPARLKIGRSASNGTVVTPVIGTPSTGSVTIGLTEQIYGRDNVTLNVQLRNTSGTVLQSAEITPENAAHAVVFNNVTDDFRIAFSTSAKRVYLTNLLTVLDGTFATDDVAAFTATPAVQEWTTTEGLTQTEYSFSNLQPGSTYVWRVKSVADGFLPQWSTMQKVTLAQPDGIEAVCIEDDAAVEVFSTTGRRLSSATYAEWLKDAAVPHGVYLIRTAAGVAKVVR